MLFHFTPYHVSVTTDAGDHKECDCIMVGVCNGHAFGGNIRLAPPAKIDDGILDVIIMQMPKDGKIMKIFPKFIKGKHMKWEITTHFKCKSVKIETPMPVNLDGEIYEGLPFECEAAKGGLNVFLPKK